MLHLRDVYVLVINKETKIRPKCNKSLLKDHGLLEKTVLGTLLLPPPLAEHSLPTAAVQGGALLRPGQAGARQAVPVEDRLGWLGLEHSRNEHWTIVLQKYQQCCH